MADVNKVHQSADPGSGGESFHIFFLLSHSISRTGAARRTKTVIQYVHNVLPQLMHRVHSRPISAAERNASEELKLKAALCSAGDDDGGARISAALTILHLKCGGEPEDETFNRVVTCRGRVDEGRSGK